MRIKSLDNRYHEYQYILHRDYHAIGDRFLRNTLIAIDYLYKQVLIQLLLKTMA